MPEAIPTIIVIDDDLPREIGGLLRSVELQPKLFASVDEFLKAGRTDPPAWCSMCNSRGKRPLPSTRTRLIHPAARMRSRVT